jgi:hypothetical protein
MRSMPKRLALAAGALAFATGVLAQPLVEWVIPALPTNKPQTPEQAERGTAAPGARGAAACAGPRAASL